MDKLLLAERDIPLRDELVELLRRRYDITTCADGRTCLELLENLRPKVAIIDLALTELEGLYVIEQSQAFRPDILLCITDFATDYVVQTLQDLGVDYIFRKPCQPRSIVTRLESIAAHTPAPGHVDLQARTGKILMDCRIPPHTEGFLYLKIAIPLFHQDQSQLLCKEIYGAIVQIYSLSGWKLVERSIRSAIHAAWELDADAFQTLFPGSTEPPTNKAFISRIAQLLDDPD